MDASARTFESAAQFAFCNNDLNAREQISGRNTRGNTAVISATVPLMNMFGYINNLRTTSRGRASFTMRFDRYAPAPPHNDPPFGPAVGMRG